MYYLVNFWDKIVKELKEEYSTKGLDKNIFISIVKDGADKYLNTFGSYTRDPQLTNEGKIRQGLVAQKAKEIQDKIDMEKAKEQQEHEEKVKIAEKNNKVRLIKQNRAERRNSNIANNPINEDDDTLSALLDENNAQPVQQPIRPVQPVQQTPKKNPYKEAVPQNITD